MSTTATPPPAYTRHPSRAPGTEIHPPAGGDDGDWVLQRGARYFRVGTAVALLAEQMDGRRDHAALATLMGEPWSPELVGETVHRLDGLGLVDRGDMTAPSTASRLKVAPPFTVQLTLLRPGRTMQRMRPLFDLAASRAVTAIAVATALAGVVALLAKPDLVSTALGSPLSLPTYLGVLLALVVGTSLHELGHAAALIRYGGRPARIGVMLFYLMPAFFCDVSDSWRLPHRGQRVRVALAGPAVQTFLAGAAALLAATLPDSDLRTGTVLFAVAGFVTGALNLLPFVKLDGYLALMSSVDVPYLRDRAMTDARRSLSRLLFGGRYDRELPGRWTTWYGYGCLVLPGYLLWTALVLWVGVLGQGGLVGLLLVALALAYVGYVLVRGARRVAREVRDAGARRARVVTVSVALGGCAAALLMIPVPYTVSGAFVARDGTVDLVFLDGTDTDAVAAGQRVELARNGIAWHPLLGTATVAGAASGAASAPLSAFFPLVLGEHDPDLPVTTYRLEGVVPPAESTGGARVVVGRLPVWEVGYRRYVRPFFG